MYVSTRPKQNIASVKLLLFTSAIKVKGKSSIFVDANFAI